MLTSIYCSETDGRTWPTPPGGEHGTSYNVGGNNFSSRCLQGVSPIGARAPCPARHLPSLHCPHWDCTSVSAGASGANTWLYYCSEHRALPALVACVSRREDARTQVIRHKKRPPDPGSSLLLPQTRAAQLKHRGWHFCKTLPGTICPRASSKALSQG